MDDFTKIQAVELEGDDGLIVTFSDGTTTAYVTEELLALRPHREPIELYSTAARGFKPTHKFPRMPRL